ncbi:MAG TPA: hypothetical protein VGB15_16850 [Longimicrobium sp.]|jgi:hypothetical protein
MHRLLILCVLGLLGCRAAASQPQTTLPNPVDVSADDCTNTNVVWNRPPAEFSDDSPGIAFISDGCFGGRIFLGIHGTRRELERAENVPLGTGGEYSDGEYRVLIQRGRTLFRHEWECGADDPCQPGSPVVDAAYEARVRIWSKSGSWAVTGTLREYPEN